ncbi:glycosyltransferase family 2 protein [Sphingobium limneticum]|uniref:glycosyltransferase family 2 protein n=1 Tax=Sphingobium limneticum TaxID=1007511 RepID=UPI00123D92BF|nr:glycosyltransferase family 2 protein [Sphingobium limneticum]KAA9013014.1 glycosyltransferase family 2 protein [Sphingobium limneticum]
MSEEQLVSIVIPAFNGASTIDETLRSVRSQSHRALEIIVVDDGSRDNTAAIVTAHAAVDPRIRLIRIANGGVAAARNRGWQEARSDLIAFVDADDLWAPDKIARQLEAMAAAGPQCGLVYCWHAKIDVNSHVTDNRERPMREGRVLDHLFRGNFIGNGSAALVRRQALLDANGFEANLWRAGAQGCEDILFYARVAEYHDFAVVPDFLVGYRYLPENMSSNMRRMLRSWMLVVDEMLVRHPDKHDILMEGLSSYGGWLTRRALYLRDMGQFFGVLTLLLQRYPRTGLSVMKRDIPAAGGQLLQRSARHIYRALRRFRHRRRAAPAPAPYIFQIGEIAP